MIRDRTLALALSLATACLMMSAGAQPTPESTQDVQCQPGAALQRLFPLSRTGVISLAFSPDQRDLYVLESTISPVRTSLSAHGYKWVKKIDLVTGNVLGKIDLGRPESHQSISSTATGSLAISANGRLLYVANNQKWISVIDTDHWKVLRRFDVEPLVPEQILLSPDGKTLYVRSNLIPYYGFALAAYATTTGKREWISSDKQRHFNYMSLAYWPEEQSLIAAVLGTTPYNTVGGDQGLRLIDPQTGEVGRQVAQGSYAFAVPGKGRTLFAARYSNNEAVPSADLLRLDGENGKIMQKVASLKGLSSVVYDASKDVLYTRHLSNEPHVDKSVLAAYKAASLEPLSSITCDGSMLAVTAVATHREGVYVAGPYWLWLLATDKSGAFTQ